MTPTGYVLFIFSGLVPFLMTSEALSAGVASVSVNKAVWSNTVFPADLAPVKAVLLGQMPMLVGMPCLVLALAIKGQLGWPVLLLPIVWGLHVLALIGLTWFLSLVNLILRDLQNLVSLLLMVLMVASPIAYTAQMVPVRLKPLLALNPFAYFVITYQNIIVLGRWPAAVDLAILAGAAVAAFGLGGLFFVRAKGLLIDYA
jgi:lipopolysaccharide transport system permease protein